MWIEKILVGLVDRALKYPKQAALILCIIAICFLGMTIKFLFTSGEQKNTAVNEKLTLDVYNLRKDIASLQADKDSLITLVGVVTADGLRREIAIKDAAIADRKAFIKQLESEKYGLEQKFNGIDKSATKLKKEILNNLKNEN